MIKNVSEKTAYVIVIVLSIVVAGLVAVLNWGLSSRPEVGFDVHLIPKFYASMNALVAVCLAAGLYFVKAGKIELHKKAMGAAFILSALFLLAYVVYHTLADSTVHPGEGLVKNIYLFILLTHIVLAALMMPFILMTFYYSLSNKLEKHRKLAKFTWPVWFYVAVTGVILYFMISPYYA